MKTNPTRSLLLALALAAVFALPASAAEATKISDVAHSTFFRGGKCYYGNAGFNGGSWSTSVFNGNFTDYLYMNGSAYLVIDVSHIVTDPDGQAFVTDVLVGHKGNTKYSLYYTTDPAPDYSGCTTGSDGGGNYYNGVSSDDRTWIPVDGASQIQEAGTKTYGVNQLATAVKYVFDTYANWGVSLAEVEVQGYEYIPTSLICLHPNIESATWSLCTPATCTENAVEERFCPDCNERFEREVPLSKLGHDFEYTLEEPGTTTSYGSGYVECTRCDEFHIEFKGDVVDLTTLGGPPINGIVQFTDLTVSSTGAEDGGVKPIYVMDGNWDNGWGHAWYSGDLGTNEWVQFAFGTKIDLTKIEYSVINEYQTVYFSKYDPATGVETLLKTIPIVKDTSDGAPGYQRRTVTFTREAEGGEEPAPAPTSDSAPTADDSNASGITVDAIRMRIGDYVDPVTGETTAYRGYNYGANDRHVIVCEFHPWGTIPGAGKVDSGAKPAFLFMQ